MRYDAIASCSPSDRPFDYGYDYHTTSGDFRDDQAAVRDFEKWAQSKLRLTDISVTVEIFRGSESKAFHKRKIFRKRGVRERIDDCIWKVVYKILSFLK